MPLQASLPSQMVVIEDSVNSKGFASSLFDNPGYDANAFDAHFLAALVGRWNQNFDADRCAHWRTSATENQRTIQSNVAGEAAPDPFFSVIPVENDGEPQRVPDGGSAVQTLLESQAVLHTWNQIRPERRVPQAAESLKIA